MLLFLLKSFLLTSFVYSQPYDSIGKAFVDHVFVSVGFTYIDDKQWYTLTTLANQFVKDTALFVTVPQIKGHNPAVIKMQQQTILNADKTVTFTIKIVQPNDSFCSKSFGWTPAYLPLTQVAWMVFELGAYTIRGYTFIAGKGTMTRASWSTSATFTNQNLIAIAFPTGCTTTTDSCVLPDASRGAINLIQTNNNVKEVGKDLYLSVRSKQIDQRRGQWVLVPHDVAPGVTSYHVLTAETLGYLAFPLGIKIECFEKMIWETASFVRNYVPGTLTYRNKYDYPPGLFGMVGTITSLCDTVLVSSNWTTTSGAFAINEDQCAKSEFIHTTPETIFLVVVGQKDTTNSTYQCYVNFNSALTPTSSPSRYPTFTPSANPTFRPTLSPSTAPTFAPSRLPTAIPSASPTFRPSTAPTFAPSTNPTINPTLSPTGATPAPSTNPTFRPSTNPTFTPSTSPTFSPTANPTSAPSPNPTFTPSSSPTFRPSTNPTFTPSTSPTFRPSSSPTFTPSASPTSSPTSNPTFRPSTNPTFRPSTSPTINPTIGATSAPTTICANSFPVEMTKV